MFSSSNAINVCARLGWSTASLMTKATVRVEQGALRGVVQKLYDGSPYYSFKGIPYALPPVGRLRFKAPLPPKSWQGTYEAIEHGPTCPQLETDIGQYQEGNEDCLFLNVYTRSLQRDSRLAVMVFIHGGAYMSGSGNTDVYGPEFLLQHNIVLVTFNYRLEALGFLCLDTPDVPGNAGVKDQIAALRWVQSNIEQFGGDPNNVTIFGESAGGTSVTYHLLSPLSKGLFHKAIAQSGVCISDWAQGVGGRERVIRAAKFLGKVIEDGDELLYYYQNLPIDKLVKITFKSMTEDEKHRGFPTHFCPVVENEFNNTEAFLTKKPIELLQTGKLNKVPLLLGYNSAEGLLVTGYQVKKLNFMNRFPSYYLPREIAQRVSRHVLEDFGDRVVKFYAGDRQMTESDVDLVEKLHTDIYFLYNCQRFSHFYASVCESIFSYRFDFVTDLNVHKRNVGFENYQGACHVDELYYMFNNEMNKQFYEKQEKLREIVFKVTKMWTDFAKTGNPTPDDALGFQWLPYTTNNREYLKIDEHMSMGRFVEKSRVEFWDGLYREAGLPCISDN